MNKEEQLLVYLKGYCLGRARRIGTCFESQQLRSSKVCQPSAKKEGAHRQ